MKKILYPTLAVVIFLIMQFVSGLLYAMFQVGNIAWYVMLSSVATVAILYCLHMFAWGKSFNVSSVNWCAGIVGIVAAAFGVASLDIAEELMELSDLMQDTFIAMSSTIEGALCIAVVAPLAEEIVFRECLLGQLLRNGTNRWIAIIASSLMFGIIHLNPIQIPFATAMGIILSVIYYKTGNIVLTSIIHILNNGAAVLQMRCLGEDAVDFRLTDWFGGITVSVLYAVAAMVVCVVMLRMFWKTYKNKKYETVY